jgi:hypothetical protein
VGASAAGAEQVMSSSSTFEDAKRIAIADRSDTLVFIVKSGTNLSAQLLGLLRTPDFLEPTAAARFENGWTRYLTDYAGAGGVFGALISPHMKTLGPILAMGEVDQLANLTRTLSLRAREITRRNFTPIMYEKEFESTVRAVSAELTMSEGNA